MKKLFGILFSCLVIFSYSSVFAMTKEEFINEIKEGYIINDSSFKLNDEDFEKVKGYIDNNDISEENLDFLMRKIDEIVIIIDKGNSTSLYDLSKEEIELIDSIIDEMIEKTGIEISNRNSIAKTAEENTNGISPVIIVFIAFIVLAGFIVLLKLGNDE